MRFAQSIEYLKQGEDGREMKGHGFFEMIRDRVFRSNFRFLLSSSIGDMPQALPFLLVV